MFNINSILVNLRLFDDGGAGAGQAGTGNTSNAAASGSQSLGETVVYGKEAAPQTVNNDGNGAGNQQTTNTDTPPTQGELIDFSNIPQEKRSDYFKRFKEAFKNEYTQEFDSHFDRRFKGHKEQETKLNSYEPIVQALMKYHNVKDIAGLQNVIDTDIMADLAEQEGFPSVEKYKEFLAAKNESTQAKAKLAEVNSQQANQDRINDWVKQGNELKKSYEGFDLSKEILIPEFAARLEQGMSVQDAYTLTHINDIVTNAAKTAAEKAKENVVSSIQTKGARIPENGTKQSPGIVRKTDPSKLTPSDLAEIRKRVARGEKITF
jgi:hypothetical protein